MQSSMSLDLAEQLTSLIVDCGDEAADALVKLLHAVADPDGQSQRHQIAWVAIRKAFPSIPDYDLAIRDHCERAPDDQPEM